MVASKFEIDTNRITSFESADQVQNGCYLWVIHADKIPPHIGVSVKGKYFSLKSNGKDESISVSSIIEVVDKKNITTLLIEVLKAPVYDQVLSVFSKYEKTKANEITCLNPLKEIFGIYDAQMLNDLLQELNERDHLGQVFGINISEAYSGIPEYKTEDIHERLRKLQDV